MTVHRMRMKDLDEAFLEKLRQSVDENAELTLWLPEKRADQQITEDQFWQLISLLNWDTQDGDQLVVQPLIDALSQLSISDVKGFEDILSEKLYLLDGQAFAEHTGENAYKGEDAAFSADVFLYARCCVVANGKAFYEEVLANPEKMPKDLTFEALLGVTKAAYQAKTGAQFEYIPAYIYETFANAEGWGGKSIFEKILDTNG